MSLKNSLQIKALKLGSGKLCWVNLGLDGKGIAMSNRIGRAMHYPVASPQSCKFEIHKCHTPYPVNGLLWRERMFPDTNDT